MDEARYVRRNERTGIRYLCADKDAQGVIGSDGRILNMASAVFSPDDRDVARVAGVNEIPDEVKALEYTWTRENGFQKYDGTIAQTNAELTDSVNDVKSAQEATDQAVQDMLLQQLGG